MKYFFPDSQDQVNLDFDFESEDYPVHRVRQRDDLYAHEALATRPFDGLLVSKPTVDGLANSAGRYSMAQRHRLYRVGVRAFFRLDDATLTMGDCGAFTYAAEPEPPYTVDEVVMFYDACGFDCGVAPDHIVFAYLRADAPPADSEDIAEWERRMDITVTNAGRFLDRHEVRNCSFEPLATAHGWSSEKYAESVARLQDLGYRRIALGGMVPLKTPDIMDILDAVRAIRKPETEFHLLGVTRCEEIPTFADFGVTSFDSTSPFRQSFKDDKDNYYTIDRGNFVALRVPQVDSNTPLKRRISSGQLDQSAAVKAERHCLRLLRAFDEDEAGLEETVMALTDYERLLGTTTDHTEQYFATLEASPWRDCRCGICERDGIQVAIFRGTERNKRRGFHNLAVFWSRLNSRLARS
jgi:hypothetical protein